MYEIQPQWYILTVSPDHNMYLTHYGQEHARLSRDQAILYDDQEKYNWVSTVISTISFTASDEFLERLNDVFVDRIVYANHWKTFMEDCLQHWRRATPVVSIHRPSFSLKLLIHDRHSRDFCV
jgi:hypothetical protein